MAHYAFLDNNNVVTEVITGRNEDEVVNGISDWDTYSVVVVVSTEVEVDTIGKVVVTGSLDVVVS